MSPPQGLRLKTYVSLALMVLFGAVGNVLLSKGMKQIGEVNDWSASALLELFLKTFTSGTIWLGVASLLVFLVSYLLVLSWADYSYVLPASATGYVVVPLLGYAVLHEVVTPVRWAGAVLICLGVALVGRTPPRTTIQS